MTIIFCKIAGSREKQVADALELLEQKIVYFQEKIGDLNYDTDYIDKLLVFCEQQQAEMVWSMEFLPVVARVCHCLHIPYISWVTEKSSYTLYSDTAVYKENFIFIAEETLYYRMQDRNKGHIFYMMPGGFIKQSEQKRDVILHLPMESKNRYLMKEECPDYLMGYLRGVIEAQLKIYGYHFVGKLLKENIKEEFHKNIHRKGLGADYIEEPLEYLMDDFLCDAMTEEEKERVAKQVNADIVLEENTDIIGDINISISDRKWKKGVSFEMLAIMGAGGFLISNYQEGLEEYFELGTELVVFEDYEDLKNKIAYYKEHVDEKMEIAKRGQKAVSERYLLIERIMDIFYILKQL